MKRSGKESLSTQPVEFIDARITRLAKEIPDMQSELHTLRALRKKLKRAKK